MSYTSSAMASVENSLLPVQKRIPNILLSINMAAQIISIFQSFLRFAKALCDYNVSLEVLTEVYISIRHPNDV